MEMDTSNSSYPDLYAKVTAARGSHAFGVATANAEAEQEETIKYEPLLPGHIYPVVLGENRGSRQEDLRRRGWRGI